jgi:PKD repeat protein
VEVTTGAGCQWTAESQASWIQIASGSSGNGPGSVSYTVDENTGSARTGTMSIAGWEFRVNQAAAGSGANNAPTEWQWTVTLDGTTVVTSDLPEFSHAFTEPGSYQVELVASNCIGSDLATEILEVQEDVLVDAWMIPAAAHLSGLHDTLWRTDARIFNPGSETVAATLEFLQEGADNTSAGPTITAEVAAMGTLVFDDLLSSFDELEGVDTKGMILVSSDEAPLRIMSRTFNATQDGSYGQYVAAVPMRPTGQDLLYLGGLTEDQAFRTNIGLANLDATEAASITVTILDPDNLELGSLTTSVLPRSSIQLVQVARLAGVADELELFTVRIATGAANMVAYASVVDNLTGDPVLYLAQPTDSAKAHLPGVAHLPGELGSVWRSDTAFINPFDSPLQAVASYIPEQELGVASDDLVLDLDPGSSIMVRDVLAEMLDTEANTKGALVVSALEGSSVPQIAARTYNLAAEGTFGQALAVFSDGSVMVSGGLGHIPGIASSADFRTNLGLFDTDGQGAVLDIALYDPDGSLVAGLTGYELTADQFTQFALSQALGLGDDEVQGSLELRVVSGGPVAAYASVIDNHTQDPILVPAQPMELQ